MTLDDFGLKIGYWFVTHKEQLRQWKVLSLLGINFLFFIFIVVATSIHLSEIPRFNRLIGVVGSVAVVAPTAETRPQQLIIGDAVAVSTEAKSYDLIAKVDNPNERWGVTALAYAFSVDGKELPRRTVALLPGRSRYIIQTGSSASDPARPVPQSVSLRVQEVSWKWVRDTELLRNVDFAFHNVEFTPRTLTRQATEAASLRAVIRNRSVVRWRTVDVGIVLVDGGKPVGATMITVKNSDPQTEEAIEVSWPRSFSSTTTPVFEAFVDLFPPDDSQSLVPRALSSYGEG